MIMKVWGKVLLGIILALLICSAANAFTEGFAVSTSNRDISVCACSSTINSIDIVNTGGSGNMRTYVITPEKTTLDIDTIKVPTGFSVSKEGSASDLSTITPGAFTLESGESIKLTDYINAPCDAPGKYDLKVYVTSQGGETQSVEQTITVSKCQNIMLKPVVYRQRVCPCSPAMFKFQLTNNGAYIEEYKLSVDTLADVTTFSENPVSLGPGEKKDIFMYVTVPCNLYGDYEITVSALAKNSKLLATVPYTLDVAACYDYDIFSLGHYEICENTLTILPIKIMNYANISNNYYLDLKTKQDWAQLSTESLMLLPQETALFNVTLSSPIGARGPYDFRIDIVTGRGGINKTETFDVAVQACYSFDVYTEAEKQSICTGNSRIPVFIENTGKFEEEFNITIIDGPSWASLSRETIRVNASATGMVYLVAEPTRSNENEAKKIRIQAEVVGHEFIKRETGTSVEVISDGNCMKATITPYLFNIKREETELPFWVTNDGRKDVKYVVSVEGPEWIEFVSSAIETTPNSTVELKLKFDPLNTTKAGTHDFKIKATTADGAIIYSHRAKAILKDNMWQMMLEKLKGFWNTLLSYLAIVWEVFSSCSTGIFTGLLIAMVIISILMIVAKLANLRIMLKAMMILMLIALLFMGAYLFYCQNFCPIPKLVDTMPILEKVGARENPSNITDLLSYIDDNDLDGSIKYQVIFKNSEKVIKVSDYFHDPDNDQMAYSAKKAKFTDIAVDGTTIIMTPEKDFIGLDATEFYADDGRGGVGSSGVVTIIVKETPQTWWQRIIEFMIVYICYIALGIVLLLFMILFALVLMREKNWEDIKNRKEERERQKKLIKEQRAQEREDRKLEQEKKAEEEKKARILLAAQKSREDKETLKKKEREEKKKKEKEEKKKKQEMLKRRIEEEKKKREEEKKKQIEEKKHKDIIWNKRAQEKKEQKLIRKKEKELEKKRRKEEKERENKKRKEEADLKKKRKEIENLRKKYEKEMKRDRQSIRFMILNEAKKLAERENKRSYDADNAGRSLEQKRSADEKAKEAKRKETERREDERRREKEHKKLEKQRAKEERRKEKESKRLEKRKEKEGKNRIRGPNPLFLWISQINAKRKDRKLAKKIAEKERLKQKLAKHKEAKRKEAKERIVKIEKKAEIRKDGKHLKPNLPNMLEIMIAALVIALGAALIFFFWEFFLMYVFYIIAGLIILAAMIIVLSYATKKK